MTLNNTNSQAVALTLVGYGGGGTGPGTSGGGGANPTFSGNISGLGGLTVGSVQGGGGVSKATGGTATFTGNLSFSGALNVNSDPAPLPGTVGSVYSTVVLQGNNSYNGTGVNLNNGSTLTLSGASGALASFTGTINANASNLNVNDSTALGSSRLNSGVTVNLNGGGFAGTAGSGTTLGGSSLTVTGAGAAASSTQNVGTLAINKGYEIITVTGAGAGQLQTLAIGSGGFTRSNNATALVRGTSLQTQATNATRVSVNGTNGTGLTLVGATTSAQGTSASGTTKTYSIVPYLIGDTSATGNGSGFLTYDVSGATSGLRPLAAGEYNTLAAGYTTPGTVENVTAFNGTITTTSDVTVNSLLFSTATQTLTGSGGNLIVNSGAILATNTPEVISGFGGVTLGNNGTWNEGILTATQANTLTINPGVTVTGSGGLTKSGNGTVILAGNNTYSGQTTINQGVLTIGAGGSTGNLGTTSGIVVNGGTGLTFNTTSSLTLSAPVTINNALTITNSNATGAVTFSGSVTSNGGANSSSATNTLTLAGAGKQAYTGNLTLNTSSTGLTANGSTALVVSGGQTVWLAPSGSNTVNITSNAINSGNVASVTSGTLNLGGDGTTSVGGNLMALTTSSNQIADVQTWVFNSNGATAAADATAVAAGQVLNSGPGTTGLAVSAGATVNVNSGFWALGDNGSNGGGSNNGTVNYKGGTATYTGGRYISALATYNLSSGAAVLYKDQGAVVVNANRFSFGSSQGSVSTTANFNVSGGLLDIAQGQNTAQIGPDANGNGTQQLNISGGIVQVGVTTSTAGVNAGLIIGTGSTGSNDVAVTLTGGTLLVGGTISGSKASGVAVANGQGGTSATSTTNFNFNGGTLTAFGYTAANIGNNATATGSTNAVASTANAGTLVNTAGTLYPGGNKFSYTTTNGTTAITQTTPVTGLTAITGNYTQASGGTLAVNLGGTTASTAFQDSGLGKFSVATVSGTTSLNGTMSINILPGFNPSTNTFNVLTSTGAVTAAGGNFQDRKSTRLNSSH